MVYVPMLIGSNITGNGRMVQRVAPRASLSPDSSINRFRNYCNDPEADGTSWRRRHIQESMESSRSYEKLRSTSMAICKSGYTNSLLHGMQSFQSPRAAVFGIRHKRKKLWPKLCFNSDRIHHQTLISRKSQREAMEKMVLVMQIEKERDLFLP
ncbi:hypothetical protein HID58_071171, partial [Brassica napus]